MKLRKYLEPKTPNGYNKIVILGFIFMIIAIFVVLAMSLAMIFIVKDFSDTPPIWVYRLFIFLAVNVGLGWLLFFISDSFDN